MTIRLDPRARSIPGLSGAWGIAFRTAFSTCQRSHSTAGYGALAGDGAAGAFTIEIIVVETSDAKSPAANAKEESVDKK